MKHTEESWEKEFDLVIDRVLLPFQLTNMIKNEIKGFTRDLLAKQKQQIWQEARECVGKKEVVGERIFNILWETELAQEQLMKATRNDLRSEILRRMEEREHA
jgi:hypothetical protein